MLHPFLLLFSTLVIISVTLALPATPIDWSIDSESLDNTDQSNLQANAENPDEPKCTADTSTTNVADDTIDNNHDLGIFRRKEGFCVPGIEEVVRGRQKLITSKPRITNKGGVDPRCTIPNQNLLVTCNGPEVWTNNAISFVLDCVLGMLFFPYLSPSSPNRAFLIVFAGEKNIIKARGGWDMNNFNLGVYCCYALDNFVSRSFFSKSTPKVENGIVNPM